jgi:hypothetical protein
MLLVPNKPDLRELGLPSIDRQWHKGIPSARALLRARRPHSEDSVQRGHPAGRFGTKIVRPGHPEARFLIKNMRAGDPERRFLTKIVRAEHPAARFGSKRRVRFARNVVSSQKSYVRPLRMAVF